MDDAWRGRPCQYHEGVIDGVEMVLDRRLQAFGPGNDKVWGEGMWMQCDDCIDGSGLPSFHHVDFHR